MIAMHALPAIVWAHLRLFAALQAHALHERAVAPQRGRALHQLQLRGWVGAACQLYFVLHIFQAAPLAPVSIVVKEVGRP